MYTYVSAIKCLYIRVLYMCVCVIGQIGFITLYPCQSIGSVTHVVVYMVGTESI